MSRFCPEGPDGDHCPHYGEEWDYDDVDPFDEGECCYCMRGLEVCEDDEDFSDD